MNFTISLLIVAPTTWSGWVLDSGCMTDHPEVTSLLVGLVPTNALALTVVLLERCRLPITNPATFLEPMPVSREVGDSPPSLACNRLAILVGGRRRRTLLACMNGADGLNQIGMHAAL